MGHTADIAYWFESGNTGKWISSSFYAKQLPKWVAKYNNTNKAKLDHYLSAPWVTNLSLEHYTECTTDNSHYEALFKGEQNSISPHNLNSLKIKRKL